MFKDKIKNLKEAMTPSEEMKAVLKATATQVAVGVVVSVAVKLSTDLIVEKVNDYRGKEVITADEA